MDISVIMPGIPIKGSRGYLGWSTVVLFLPKGAEGSKGKEEGQGAILCDTGSYGDRHLLLEKLRNVLPANVKVEMVALTHLHFDHAQSVDLFPDARVVVSRREWEYVTSGEYKEVGDTFVPAPLIFYLEGLKDRMVWAEDMEEIAPGITCVMLPGHTPGSMGLWVEEQKLMVVGDAVKNGQEFEGKNPGYHFASRDDWLKSRKRVEMADRIIPGHDAPFMLKKGKITGLDASTVVTLYYTPYKPRLDALVIERG